MKALSSHIEMRRMGIYKIWNTVNNKIYIGSAICFYKRKAQHTHDLLSGRHNKRFCNFVKKYGIASLVFEIVEFIDDAKTLINREQEWINKMQSFVSSKGFNVSKIAGSTYGVKMPESHKKACSKRMKGNNLFSGKKHSEETKRLCSIASQKKTWTAESSKKLSLAKRGVPIWQDKKHPQLGNKSTRVKTIAVYKNGELIDILQGTKKVAEKYGGDHAQVVRVCNGIKQTSHGYVFRYVEPSSRMCTCGKVNARLTLSDRVWTCETCGSVHDRDHLAAQNILKFGLQKQNIITATGGTSGRASGRVVH